MVGKKKVEVRNPYIYHPKFCKYDGKELLHGKELHQTSFDEETGESQKSVRYFSYCPDWAIERSVHTEYWAGLVKEDNKNDAIK